MTDIEPKTDTKNNHKINNPPVQRLYSANIITVNISLKVSRKPVIRYWA
jgi:hypothetical protein